MLNLTCEGVKCDFKANLKLKCMLYVLMVEAKKNKWAYSLKEAKPLCKEVDFTAVMVKCSLADERIK